MTDHDNLDDVNDSSTGEHSPPEPSSLESPSVMALAGAITGALGVVLAALPILAMLWVWLAL
ncbi:MAG: hypothetical protein EBY42_07310 [Actinobacteria bacterium]|nr:hypothetical protein [Actinomycetota bacterium]